jgi:hypothetical protein
MSNGGAKKGEQGVMTVAKRARTADVVNVNAFTGHVVQLFHHHKPFSLTNQPWQLIDGPYHNIKINEELVVGLNIIPGLGNSFTVFPYGPEGMKCSTRDGCGGIVQRGQALQWQCNALLRVQAGPFTTDVMVVHLDAKQPIDGAMDIEKLVQMIFHVVADADITQPCWLLGSIEANQRDSWQEIANTLSAERVQFKLSLDQLQTQFTLMQQQHTTYDEAMQKKLQLYVNTIEEFRQVATCGICHQVMPTIKPCKVAECGHFRCEDCHADYFHALGFSPAKCHICSAPAPEESWQPSWLMTSIVADLTKLHTELQKLEAGA